VSVTLDALVAWTARDAVLAQLERYRPLARADARYRVTAARLEATLDQALARSAST
jgi:hypothetical protein